MQRAVLTRGNPTVENRGVEQWVEGRPLDDLNLKGFNHPILAAEIFRWRKEGETAEAAAPAAAAAPSAEAARRRTQ